MLDDDTVICMAVTCLRAGLKAPPRSAAGESDLELIGFVMDLLGGRRRQVTSSDPVRVERCCELAKAIGAPFVESPDDKLMQALFPP